MSNYIIKNNDLTVTISDYGAEVISIINKEGNEIIHQGCEVYSSHCPICFPIIGCFKNDTYSFNGEDYKMKIHGFASSALFEVNEISPNEISFKTVSTEQTLKIYPFEFILTVTYKLDENKLITEYEMKNCGRNTMYYSIGTHTGFKIDKGFSAYRIRFETPEENEQLNLLPISYRIPKDELIKDGIISLDDSLFVKGCFTLGNIKNKKLILEENNGKKVAKIDFSEFGYITVWSAPGQAYVCIEPWSCESAHYTDNNFLDKQKDITSLSAGEIKKQRHIYNILM